MWRRAIAVPVTRDDGLEVYLAVSGRKPIAVADAPAVCELCKRDRAQSSRS